MQASNKSKSHTIAGCPPVCPMPWAPMVIVICIGGGWFLHGGDWAEQLEPPPPHMASCHWCCCSSSSWWDESRCRIKSEEGCKSSRITKVTKVVWRAILAPEPATYTTGELKQCSEMVVRDPCQGSGATFRIECCRSFATLIAQHPHRCQVGQVHKTTLTTDEGRFHSQYDGGPLPWLHCWH
jgi:hypothetical protein